MDWASAGCSTLPSPTLSIGDITTGCCGKHQDTPDDGRLWEGVSSLPKTKSTLDIAQGTEKPGES